MREVTSPVTARVIPSTYSTPSPGRTIITKVLETVNDLIKLPRTSACISLHCSRINLFIGKLFYQRFGHLRGFPTSVFPQPACISWSCLLFYRSDHLRGTIGPDNYILDASSHSLRSLLFSGTCPCLDLGLLVVDGSCRQQSTLLPHVLPDWRPARLVCMIFSQILGIF